jgi:hypothetical protein
MPLSSTRKPLDAYNVIFQTSMSNSYVESLLKEAKNVELDTNRVERLKKCECRACHYRRRVAGQAFTAWSCGICGIEKLHHNTAVPRVCLDCAKKHSLCTRCGADLELRPKRRKFDWIAEPQQS